MKYKTILIAGLLAMTTICSLNSFEKINAKESIELLSIDNKDKAMMALNEYSMKIDTCIQEEINLAIEEEKAKEQARIEAERLEQEKIEKQEKAKSVNGAVSVRSGNKVKIVGVGFDQLNVSKFGNYGNHAKTLHDLITSGNTNTFTLEEFASIDDAYTFADVFYELYGLKANMYIYKTSQIVKIEYASEDFKVIQNYRRTLNLVNSTVRNIVSNDMTETEAINAISDWIINRTTYMLDMHSAILIFDKGVGNCNAYATTFKLMCEAVSLPCDIVIGNAGGAHGWNRVLINSSWYYVDLTFADSTKNSKYLLSENLWGDHTFKKIDNKFKYN